MKKILFLLILIKFSLFYGQNNLVKGQIFDKNTREPLAFANVFIDKNVGTTADFEGKFSFKVPKNITKINISYIGYENKKVKITNSFLKIYLQPVSENLNEVVLSTKVKNPAIRIIKQIIKRKKENDYRKIFDKYTYTKYFKFLVSADRDSLNCTLDTIRNPKKNNKLIRIDSSMYHFCKDVKDKELYIFENIIKTDGKNGKKYNKVIATHTAGFKKPLYELLQIQMTDQSVYNDFYKFLFKDYLSPLTIRSLKQYKYKIKDTLFINKRKVYKIAYRNTKSPIIVGDMFVDVKNYAIAKMSLNSYNKIQLKTIYNFKFYKNHNVWFPLNSETVIRKAKQRNNINAEVVNVNFTPKDTLSHSNPQREGDFMFAKMTAKYTDIKFNQNSNDKKIYNLIVEPNASKKNDDTWNKYRKLNKLELKTYVYIDSLFKVEKVEKKLYPFRKLLTGFYPIGFFDINLFRILDYNKYEGFRLQLGGKTNEKISNKFYVDGYLAYGFGDKKLKYKGGFHYKLSHFYQSFIDINYTNDLKKSSMLINEIFNLSKIDATNHIAYEKYEGYKGFDLGFRTLFSSRLSFKFNLYKYFYDRKFDIPFKLARIEFNNYDVAGVKSRFIWEPKSRYMLNDFGRTLIQGAFPKFLFGIETNFPEFQVDKHKFTKIKLQGIYRKTYLNKDYTDLFIKIGFVFGEPNISQLYQPDFNNLGNNAWNKNINLNGLYRFETVKDFEFLNNYLFTAHLSHRINNVVEFNKNHKMDIRLTTAFALGFSSKQNQYIGIKDLRHSLFESGIEFHNLISGFGLGFYYRYGYYASTKPIENLAIGFNLKPFSIFR